LSLSLSSGREAAIRLPKSAMVLDSLYFLDHRNIALYEIWPVVLDPCDVRSNGETM
jgi:hypothetical protein